jgi:hypothetical protein
MDATDETTVAATEPAAAEPAPLADATSRLLGTVGLALAALAALELIGTVVVGLAVKVARMNFPTRQGYAFLTQLEKSPVALVLVVASVAAAASIIRSGADGSANRFAPIALWIVMVAAVLLGVGTILSVVARFRVAQLAPNQPVDALTRRVLVTFVIRNFGLAVVALLVAVGYLFQPRRPAPVD